MVFSKDESRSEESARPEEGGSLETALAEEKAKAASYLGNWQRAQADLANYRRRAEAEKEETARFANTFLALSLLPILDDWGRAFGAIPRELAGQPWVEGIRLVDRKLRATLEAQGLSPIKSEGELFDPSIHEAARQEPGKEGYVVRELEKGYRFRDRVIRPAKVAVGAGEGEGGGTNG